MTQEQHPIASAELHVFHRQTAGSGTVNWIAKLYPYDAYPIFFSGATEADCIARAEEFRAETIAKFEAEFIARAKAAAERREKRKAKEAAE